MSNVQNFVEKQNKKNSQKPKFEHKHSPVVSHDNDKETIMSQHILRLL